MRKFPALCLMLFMTTGIAAADDIDFSKLPIDHPGLRRPLYILSIRSQSFAGFSEQREQLRAAVPPFSNRRLFQLLSITEPPFPAATRYTRYFLASPPLALDSGGNSILVIAMSYRQYEDFLIDTLGRPLIEKAPGSAIAIPIGRHSPWVLRDSEPVAIAQMYSFEGTATQVRDCLRQYSSHVRHSGLDGDWSIRILPNALVSAELMNRFSDEIAVWRQQRDNEPQSDHRRRLEVSAAALEVTENLVSNTQSMTLDVNFGKELDTVTVRVTAIPDTPFAVSLKQWALLSTDSRLMPGPPAALSLALTPQASKKLDRLIRMLPFAGPPDDSAEPGPAAADSSLRLSAVAHMLNPDATAWSAWLNRPAPVNAGLNGIQLTGAPLLNTWFGTWDNGSHCWVTKGIALTALPAELAASAQHAEQPSSTRVKGQVFHARLSEVHLLEILKDMGLGSIAGSGSSGRDLTAKCVVANGTITLELRIPSAFRNLVYLGFETTLDHLELLARLQRI